MRSDPPRRGHCHHLSECARKLSVYLSGVRRAAYQAERKSIFERYANETAIAISELTGEKADKIEADIKKLVAKNIKIIEMNEKAQERLEKGEKGKNIEEKKKEEGKEEPKKETKTKEAKEGKTA